MNRADASPDELRHFVRAAVAAVLSEGAGVVWDAAGIVSAADLRLDLQLSSLALVELACVLADGLGVPDLPVDGAGVRTVADAEALVLTVAGQVGVPPVARLADALLPFAGAGPPGALV